jgi:hypothetical protein
MRTVNLNEKKMMFGFNIGGKLVMREKITVNHFT